MLENFVKAVGHSAMLGVDCVLDVVTLGGVVTETEPRTLRRLEKIMDLIDPDSEEDD